MTTKTQKMKWTKKEDNIVLSYVKSYPNNLRAAFEEASKEIDRSPMSISVRYYKNIKDNNLAISVVSNTGVATLHNQKNARRDLKSNLSEDDIFEITMSNLVKMNRTYKKKAIELLMNL
jgi:hypothetical protein